VRGVTGSVSRAPTTKSAGVYKVTITPSNSKVAATGKVTVRFYKVGAHGAVVTGTLANDTTKISVPKLKKGTWSVLISWAGNKSYLAASVRGTSIKVTH
jgi:hypothetical protein